MIYNIIIISGEKKPYIVLYSLGTAKQTKHIFRQTTRPPRVLHEREKRHWTVLTVGMFMNEADPCGFACARLPWVQSSKPCCPSTLAQQQQQHPPVQASRLHYTPARQSQWLRATLRLTRLKHQKLFAALPSAPSSSRPRFLPGIRTTGQSPRWTGFFRCLFFLRHLSKQCVCQSSVVQPLCSGTLV